MNPDPAIVDRFGRFCEKATGHLGDLVARACTINEPNIVSFMGYMGGVFPPGPACMWWLLVMVSPRQVDDPVLAWPGSEVAGGQEQGAVLGAVAAQHQDFLDLEGRTDVAGDLLDDENVVLGNLVLLPAGADDREHDLKSLNLLYSAEIPFLRKPRNILRDAPGSTHHATL